MKTNENSIPPPPPSLREIEFPFIRPHCPPTQYYNNKPNYKIHCKARPDYHLTIRDGQVILAPSDPSDPCQNWYKDDKYGTQVKDEAGHPAFSLINKATGQALKHSTGSTLPVRLQAYNPDVVDESVLWSESENLGGGCRAIRMVNNISLNMDAFYGGEETGGVYNGTIIGLWQWNNGDNQKWKICVVP